MPKPGETIIGSESYEPSNRVPECLSLSLLAELAQETRELIFLAMGSNIEGVDFVGKPYVVGNASATLLAADLELSFWGGVDPATGEIIDRFHPLSGRLLKDTILAIPGGRGSCGGSAVMMELILNGLGPKALIFERCEDIITLGVIVAEEFFYKTIPVLQISRNDFRSLLKYNGQTLHLRGDKISNTSVFVESEILKSSGPAETDMRNMGIKLSKYDKEVLDGAYGEAARISLKVIIRMTDMISGEQLLDVEQAHVDPAWYGPGSLYLAQRLRQLGGKVRVPSTVNSINIDTKRWRAQGVDIEAGEASLKTAQAFLDMGCEETYTCAPYLLETAPRMGSKIAWGESNAVLFANSVLGARTLKNPNILEFLIALTGRAPEAGAYLDKNRKAAVWIKVAFVNDIDDSFWPIVGFAIGAVASNRVPVITGLDDKKPTKDDLKAFAAAFATSSSAPLFHIVGVTPESPTAEATFPEGCIPEVINFGLRELEKCWEEFNHGTNPRDIDLVSFGNPHFSFKEIKKLACLVKDRKIAKGVSMIITSGRAQFCLAQQEGCAAQLESFGAQFLQDTC